MNLKVNFASSDLGARVMKSSEGCIGSANVLRRDGDRYMLSPCHESLRYVVIELSQEIVVEVVEIINREYYSSSPQQVMLLGSGTFPSDKWQHLGIFDFGKGLKVQALRLHWPSIVRYLKVVFSGSQGSEFYCTITEIRVFGKTLIDDWKQDMDIQDQTPSIGGMTSRKRKWDVPKLPSYWLRGGARKFGSGYLTLSLGFAYRPCLAVCG